MKHNDIPHRSRVKSGREYRLVTSEEYREYQREKNKERFKKLGKGVGAFLAGGAIGVFAHDALSDKPIPAQEQITSKVTFHGNLLIEEDPNRSNAPKDSVDLPPQAPIAQIDAKKNPGLTISPENKKVLVYLDGTEEAYGNYSGTVIGVSTNELVSALEANDISLPESALETIKEDEDGVVWVSSTLPEIELIPIAQQD